MGRHFLRLNNKLHNFVIKILALILYNLQKQFRNVLSIKTNTQLRQIALFFIGALNFSSRHTLT
jgi:hypothetical protein